MNATAKKSKSVTSIIIEVIHNRKTKRPLVLLMAGLGTTYDLFRCFGMTRLNDESFIKWDELDSVSERAINKDWLVREGKAKGDVSRWSIRNQWHR